MKYAQILHDIVLPHLLQREGFKQALADAVSEIPITELETITSELSKWKTLTIGTLPEASNNLLANMIVEMIVTLKDAVEAYAHPSEKPQWTPTRGHQVKLDPPTKIETLQS